MWPRQDLAVVIMALVYLTDAISTIKLANSSGAKLIYTGNHNIYNMFWKVSHNDNETCVFIAEAEIDKYGKVQDHGLFVLNDFEVKKIRDSGRDGVMATDGSNLMLVGTTDGVYRCNCSSCEQEKYGCINDSIIGIVMERGTAKIYILNEEKQLYAITEQGNNVSIDHRVQNAHQIMMDCNDNLYYYGPDKQPYLVNNKGTKKIIDIPANPTRLKLLRPILAKSDSQEEALMAVDVDSKIYGILPNASSELSKLSFLDSNFTMINIENPMIMFFAKDKDVYVFSPITAILQALINNWVKNKN